MKYQLASSTWDNDELDAIQSVIDSDMYSMGESVKQFELDFSKYLRFLIIAIIIIAVLLFIGMQLININKSMD